jgi:hypothetical protein
MSTLAPCGTKAARRRHARNQEACAACTPAPKPAPPCGTYPAYRKGCRCEPCRATNRARVQSQARRIGVTPKVLAPCGTKAAKQRHRSRDETCDTCAKTGGREIHECGTWQSRRRHKRNNETCTVCDASKPTPKTPRPPRAPRELSPKEPRAPRALAPCGTPSAKRRHRNRGETCTTCTTTKPAPEPRQPKPLQPCGTEAAFKRHQAHGEPPCDTCTDGYRQHARERAQTARRAKGIPERISNEDFIAELEFLLNAGEGEKRILEALGYTGRPHTLHQRLYRTKRHDLATRIFGYELAA